MSEYQDYPYGYGMRQPDPQDLSLVEQTNPDEVVEKIEMTLKGRVWNKHKEEWELKDWARPIVNDFGINSLMADVRPFVNQISTLSNATIDQISKITIQIADTVITKLEMNWKEFGVDKSNLTTVVNAITMPSFMTGLRALGEGERRFLKTSVRAVESFTQNTNAPHQSQTTDKLKFWR